MIVDTSAILAVLFREDEAPEFENLIAGSSCRMSAANVLESAMVVEGRGGFGRDWPVGALRARSG